MRTRSTSSIETRRCAPIVTLLLLFAVFASCDDDEATPAVARECRPNQFRLCDADCGRGVEQCVEPGRWNGCSCTVLDAGFVIDARADRDGSEGGDASSDSAAESGEDGEPSESGDAVPDAEGG